MDITIPPIRSWEKFESLCLDIYKREWDDNEAQKNGRSGQAQSGIDVFGSSNNIGVQCKKKDFFADSKLTIKEIVTEVEKAKGFNPPLKKFIIAYTGPRDAILQKKAREISGTHKGTGMFSVHVVSWSDLEEKILSEYPELLKIHYPIIYRAFKGEDLEKDNELQIIDDILSEVSKIKLKEIVASMTGIPNSAYMFASKENFANFIGFNDWLNANIRMEKDFKNLDTYDLYYNFIESYINLFESQYEYGEINDDSYKDDVVLGYNSNPKWNKRYGDSIIYSTKLRKAEDLGKAFDKAYDALRRKWRELKTLIK